MQRKLVVCIYIFLDLISLIQTAMGIVASTIDDDVDVLGDTPLRKGKWIPLTVNTYKTPAREELPSRTPKRPVVAPPAVPLEDELSFRLPTSDLPIWRPVYKPPVAKKPVAYRKPEPVAAAIPVRSQPKVLGKGAYGCVITDSSCPHTEFPGSVASKLFFADEDARQELEIERNAGVILAELDPESKSSVRMVGNCTKPGIDYDRKVLSECTTGHRVGSMVIQADYPLGGNSLLSLGRSNKELPFFPLFTSFAQLLDFVHRLHTLKRMFHFDISLANVLVDTDKYSVRLIDWGMAGSRPLRHVLAESKYYVYPPDTPMFVAARYARRLPYPQEIRLWFDRYRQSMRWAMPSGRLSAFLTNSRAEEHFVQNLDSPMFEFYQRLPEDEVTEVYYPSIDTFGLGLCALALTKNTTFPHEKFKYHIQMLGLGMAAPLYNQRATLPAAMQYLDWILRDLQDAPEPEWFQVPEFARRLGFRDLVSVAKENLSYGGKGSKLRKRTPRSKASRHRKQKSSRSKSRKHKRHLRK
jgi:hypothetical protein